jgi:RimJ/RimL family protein N-acetyltransferase
MNENIFRGAQVRLVAEEPEALSQAISRWDRNTEYHRLLDDTPSIIWSTKKVKEWFEKDLEKETGNAFNFFIRTLEDDKLIGFVELDGIRWAHGDAWVGIGIGDSQYWGKGFGTDAMHVILRYAFTELNLHRITLGAFSYNQRALLSYQKAGFIIEGRERGALLRDGERADIVFMGVLRQEWLAQNG